MKKMFLIMTMAFVGIVSARAQVWLGGALSANLTKESQSFSIAPDVGYCFAGTPFSIACAIEYTGLIQHDEGYTHGLTVSPYFRYEFGNLEDRFSLFVDLTGDIDALNFSHFNIGLAPGVSFNLTQHWSAEFSYGFLGYRRTKLTDQTVNHSFEFDFKAATAEFGIYYNF